MQVKYLMIQQDLNTNFNFLAHVNLFVLKIILIVSLYD